MKRCEIFFQYKLSCGVHFIVCSLEAVFVLELVLVLVLVVVVVLVMVVVVVVVVVVVSLFVFKRSMVNP